MFIYFSIENFKAFRDKQEVRFLADPNATEVHPRLKRNVYELDAFPGAKFLKVLAFFGANASGKSTVLEGLGLLSTMIVKYSNFARGQKLPFNPFRMRESSRTMPTSLQLQFYIDDVAYQYKIEYANTIKFEQLELITYDCKNICFAEQKNGLIYKRTPGAKKQLELGPAYVSESKPEEDERYYNKSLEGRHGNITLALPLLGQFNNLTYFNLLRELTEGLAYFLSSDNKGFLTDLYLRDYTTLDDKTGLYDIVQLMKDLGISVDMILLHPREFELKFAEFKSKFDLNSMETETEAELTSINMDEDRSFWEGVEKGFGRTPKEAEETSENKPVFFSFKQDESSGTRRLYNSLGVILDALDKKHVMLYDEIDAHLHSLLSRAIVKRFLDPKTNPRNVQLVYTTNDATHFDVELLRNDQIYICQKDESTDAVEIGPLSDFDPAEIRGRLPHLDLFAKDYYLQGHFYGVPDISEESDTPKESMSDNS